MCRPQMANSRAMVRQTVLAEVSSSLIFSSEPFLGGFDPVGVDLVEQVIVAGDDSAFPHVPKAGEVLPKTHGALVVWVCVCIRPASATPLSGRSISPRDQSRCIRALPR